MTARDLFFIVNRSGSDSLLLLRSDNGLRLPAYDMPVPEDVGFLDPHPFNTWFAKRYGMPVIRRYPLDLQGTEAAFFMLETRERYPKIPNNALWVSPNAISKLVVTPPNHCALIETWWCDSQESATMPFSRPCGFAFSLAWMDARLDQLEMSVIGDPQQVKNAYVSTVFRCPTTSGNVYLKILPPVFVREAQITAKLCEWRVTRLPQILAIDATHGLILTKEMHGCDLTDYCTVENLEAVVQHLADFQLKTVDFVNPQTPWTFYDARIRVLTNQIDALFDEAPTLLDRSPYALSATERFQLRQQLPAWKQLYEEIGSTALPDMIDHGDLRPGNIRVVADRFILYDWAWSAITHPFLSIAGLLGVVRRSLPEPRKNRPYLRDAYLEAFTGYASGQELRRIFDLVTQAMTLYAVAVDAEWVRAIHRCLIEVPGPVSADAWTLRWRQYYYAKVVRRLFADRNPRSGQ